MAGGVAAVVLLAALLRAPWSALVARQERHHMLFATLFARPFWGDRGERPSDREVAVLFDDFEDGSTRVARSSLHIPNSFTTNPQAEVLVFGVIPAQAITAVCVERRNESYALYSSSWSPKPCSPPDT